MADAQRVFPEDKIVFVNQDEAFFEDYGSWPLRRLDLAQVAENVEALGGRVMAVDNLFDFPLPTEKTVQRRKSSTVCPGSYWCLRA